MASPGKAYCIIGPGKSGKSTLLKYLAGLPLGQDFFFSGEAFLAGKHFYVPQNIHMKYIEADARDLILELWGSARVQRKLKEIATNPNHAWKAAELKLLGLSGILSTIHEPSVILLDEPDVKMADYFQDLILMINSLKKNHCIIIVTHNVEFMLAVGDHLTYVVHGKIIESGTKEEFVASENEDVQYLLRLGV